MPRRFKTEELARRALLKKLHNSKPGKTAQIFVGHCSASDSLGLQSLQAVAERIARLVVDQDKTASHPHMTTYFVKLAGDIPGYAIMAGVNKRRSTAPAHP